MADEFESIENLNEEQSHPSFGKRRLNSAEKYFNWASKSNRKLFERLKQLFIFYFFSLGPMEYLRGKRFWLFGKKDEHKNKHEIMSNAHELSHSPSQGIWRSGIVGRRRR